MLRWRTACARRLSWVNTMACRVKPRFFQYAGETVDLGRVHRLHRVVDENQETERAGGQCRAWQRTLRASALTSPWLMTPSA